jgi:hypothetical protein
MTNDFVPSKSLTENMEDISLRQVTVEKQRQRNEQVTSRNTEKETRERDVNFLECASVCQVLQPGFTRYVSVYHFLPKGDLKGRRNGKFTVKCRKS